MLISFISRIAAWLVQEFLFSHPFHQFPKVNISVCKEDGIVRPVVPAHEAQGILRLIGAQLLCLA